MASTKPEQWSMAVRIYFAFDLEDGTNNPTRSMPTI
jgi:hypothetical protein